MSKIILPPEVEEKLAAEKELLLKKEQLENEVKRQDELRKRKPEPPLVQMGSDSHKLSEDERRIRRMKNKQKKFRNKNFRRRRGHGR